MKQLVTMTACLMLLMALLSQFVQNQKLLMQLEAGSHAVDVFCETKDEVELKRSLSRIMNCEPAELSITEGEDCCVIKTPVKPVLSASSFWGIDEDANRGVYRWERKVRDE